ncbi:MAG: bifunctional hydroxymethylpyrimidine kinase/phosphomethylpyrimidine kinase [Pseudomonadota bacterium]
MIPNILSIAGSDPSGGAGIQADMKAIAANGGFAMAAITALTAQNTQGVAGVHLVPPAFVRLQVDTVFEDVAVHGVKIGMVGDAAIAAAVAEALEGQRDAGRLPPVVLDPVMVASTGARLLDDAAVETIVTRLMPLATVVTPNLRELAALTGAEPATDRAAMQAQAERLIAAGAAAVLAKGGHMGSDASPDLLIAEGTRQWYEGARVATRNTHGTGCSLASALATWLGRGLALAEAAGRAKTFIARAIAESDALDVGHGHGPVHHFGALYAAAGLAPASKDSA